MPSIDFGWFDDVIYTELSGENAKKKVQEFNEKGKKALKERDRDSGRNDRRRGKILSKPLKFFGSFNEFFFDFSNY